MLSPNSYEGIDTYAADLIRNKARLLIGKAGLTESDRPDLEQELMIDLLERMKRYNPAKAKKTTFMARIVERRIASLLEKRFAQRRDCRLCSTSLNEIVPGNYGDRDQRVDLLSSDLNPASKTSEPLERKSGDMQIDLEEVIASLPEQLRDLCERLRTSNMMEISRDTGICRGTLYYRLTLLREAFQEAGLKEYL
ncbi:sigma-70 family RNA polymerase sigma factor [Verrucomicrobia bacterium S94]|nr:sigma-70 family RNA polymerase sigma factor [Verrucomicrobia bacterium S94]